MIIIIIPPPDVWCQILMLMPTVKITSNHAEDPLHAEDYGYADRPDPSPCGHSTHRAPPSPRTHAHTHTHYRCPCSHVTPFNPSASAGPSESPFSVWRICLSDITFDFHSSRELPLLPRKPKPSFTWPEGKMTRTFDHPNSCWFIVDSPVSWLESSFWVN